MLLSPWCNACSWPPAHIPSTVGLFSFWPLSPSHGPTRDPWDCRCVQGSALPHKPRAAGHPGTASASQTCLLASSWSQHGRLGSWQQFPKSRQELQLALHLDRAWREEKADTSGKKEHYGNSTTGTQTFRMGADSLKAWKGTSSPTSTGNGKCKHSKQRVRLVPFCPVRSRSHTRWMLSKTTNYSVVFALTHGPGLAVAMPAGVTGSSGWVWKHSASPEHPHEKQVG